MSLITNPRDAIARPSLVLATLVAAAAVAGVPAGAASQGPPPSAAQTAPASAASVGNLDVFMERVLARRDENWRKLHDYILSETESFKLSGPAALPLNGFKREYAWYVRDGYLVRSPVRFDGAAVPEADRRKYEEDWLKQERQRETKATASATSKTAAAKEAAAAKEGSDAPSLDAFVGQRGEPRFISEAYFLRFKFEPGNYYLVGREQFAGRDVVKIEYYPTRLFGDDHAEKSAKADKPAGAPKKGKAPSTRARKASEKDQVDEAELVRKMNKVALVTLWVDPAEYQVVKYTFDNTEFDFLPGRWLVRLGDVSATMTMVRVLDGVWLPGQISMHADLTFASGTFGFVYGRSFYDYKKAEVGARIRMIGPRQP